MRFCSKKNKALEIGCFEKGFLLYAGIGERYT